jgi:hypothetical protein
MSEKSLDNPDDANSQSIDLNTLSSLDFGPSWVDGKNGSAANKHSGGYGASKNERKGKRRPASGGSRDRRPPNASRGGSQGQVRDGSGQRGKNDGRRWQDRGAPRDVFQPTVKIDIYPQDEAFDALLKRLQMTARTYQLFEITKLLLEKAERFMIVVTAKPSNGKESSPKNLYFSVQGHLPFETEEEAVGYVLNEHLDQFFDVETVEVEAPKGNFQIISRCSVTGELLGPPNYHRYQEFLQRHYANKINGLSFEKFQSKIESVKDQESIDSWLESMKQGTRYTVKDPKEGEPTVLESFEAARLFLLQFRKAEVVGSGESVRFAGRDIARLTAGDIRRSVEAYIEQQCHFPLETANNIRGRLRRHNFTIYKKGAKGASFVCAVKRKFRDSKTVFTDSIQKLIDYIEQNPEMKASVLPKNYLDIIVPSAKPAKLKLSDAEIKAAEHTDKTTEQSETAPEAETSNLEAGSETVELSEADAAKLKQLKLDLRWLVTEGYVTEYGDGRLLAPPVVPDPKPKVAEKPKAVNPPKVESESAVESVDTVAPLEQAEENTKN